MISDAMREVLAKVPTRADLPRPNLQKGKTRLEEKVAKVQNTITRRGYFVVTCGAAIKACVAPAA